MKRALITGITGQDGSYLSEHLLNEGYDVWGLVRRTSNNPFSRLENVVNHNKAHILYGDLRDTGSLARALDESQPDEIYNLAAQSDVWVSFKCPEEAQEINYYGLGRLVNEAMKRNPKVRIYQASTSEMFGKSQPPQNETSPFAPVSPYGEAKLKAHQDFVEGYRERFGLFIASGILFNHESPRRGLNFVSRKVTSTLAKIKLGLADTLTLGNLEAKRDWGYAGDYVKAMHRILQQEKPGDYVIATGESHTVREFVEAACAALDMPITWKGSGLEEVGVTADGKTIVTISKEFYRPVEVDYLLGDATKARTELNWTDGIGFAGLVKLMVDSDYELLKNNRALT